MSTAIIDNDCEPTVAELLDRLGNVPAERVRLHPPPGHATEDDVLRLHARSNRLFELIDGVLVEKAMGYRESFLAMFIGRLIGNYLEQHNLGIVAGADGMMRLAGRNIRIPDVSFVSWSQLPGRQVPKKPVPNLYPDLAVEVLSDSNTPGEMALKRLDYFGAGTRLVWEIDPERRVADVFKAAATSVRLDSNGTLDGGDVLPGFQLPLADLFRELDPRPAAGE